jgi:hypothetical protein
MLLFPAASALAGTVCEPPAEPTFTVTLPKVGTPPDDEGQGWTRPEVWEHHPSASNDSITVPNGRPIYALIVSGFGSNRYLDELMVYNFARYLLTNGAYVHYAWWNNLLAPYMERPLHHPQSHPGGISDGIANFETAEDASRKAVPGEDYQFLADAKRFLSAIRQHNPRAIIIVVGHSMGGGAVVHLGSQTGILIDILAPIDAVGNRNYPWAGTSALTTIPVRHDFNWTRWRVTRDNFLGYKRADFQGVGTGCVAVGPWLKDATDTGNDRVCANVLFAHEAGPLRFDDNIINLHYRWQNEFLFPFDYEQNYTFGHSQPPNGSTSQSAVAMTPQFCGAFDRCEDPGGWPEGGDRESACCETGAGVGWPRDGHGEIVGQRGPLLGGNPIPLGVRVRTSPQCGDNCSNRSWPSRLQSPSGTWSNPNSTGRVDRLKALETLPANEAWTNRPTNPNLCLVSAGLIHRFEVMNKPPFARAGADQFIECGSGPLEATLDGSASSDPDGDLLQYTWTGNGRIIGGAIAHVPLLKGTNCFTLAVKDPSGHIDRDTVGVVVADTIPPDLSVKLSPQLLWPPNHKLVDIRATVQASDRCGQVSEVKLLSIVCNQADNGSGDGNTKGDIVARIGLFDRMFKLRAERAGPGRDRIYTVTYRATDDSGNGTNVSANVVVPHDAKSHQNWLKPTKR